MRCLVSGDLLGCTRGHHVTAGLAAFGSEVDEVVGRLDDVEIVLDDEQRVALLEQLAERGQQLGDVVEVQPRRRLVEDVQQPLAAGRARCAAILIRCASPPDSVVAGCPSRR